MSEFEWRNLENGNAIYVRLSDGAIVARVVFDEDGWSAKCRKTSVGLYASLDKAKEAVTRHLAFEREKAENHEKLVELMYASTSSWQKPSAPPNMVIKCAGREITPFLVAGAWVLLFVAVLSWCIS